MLIAGVIERGLADHAERQRTTDDAHTPNQLMFTVPGGGLVDRHKIGNFTDPIRRQETGNKNVGVRPIELLVRDVVSAGADLKTAGFVVVEQGAEHAGRVERGKAEPVDGAVHSHQSRSVQVADQAVVLYRLVCHSIFRVGKSDESRGRGSGA